MQDEAIRSFLHRDHDRVVRAVAVVCGDRQRAEDAVQEALVDVWTEQREVDDLTAWVTTAAINRSRSRWRSLAAERRAFERLAVVVPVAERQPDAEVVFDARLAELLRNLPRSQRAAVALHYLLDLSVADVAARLGMAEGTVKTHLHRARQTLRATLEASADSGAVTDTEEARHAGR